MSMLNEISTNRILSHFKDNGTLAIISTYRTERPEAENKKLLNKLKAECKVLKLGFTEFISRWVEKDPETNDSVTSDERSLMIYGISLETAMHLGQEYDQSSIIFKDKSKCAEVCTCDFKSYDGKSFKPNDVVRKFNLDSNKPLNLSKAENIFEKRLSGPASKAIKSNRAFTLSEVLEVEAPRGSNFSTTERYR